MATNAFKLRPYQEEDVKKLASLNRGGCFNEQRTGKTPTILYTIKKRKLEKVLIVCTGSGLPAWKEHWLDHINSNVISVEGTRKQREKQIAAWETGALVITYDALKRTTNAQGFIEEILRAKPQAVIVDEIHNINGRTTAVAKAVNRLTRIPIRYALTGTLVRDKKNEVWCTLHWLYPEYFSSYWRFVAEYFITWEMNVKTSPIPITQIGRFKDGMERKLQGILDSFSTQRKRVEVMPWLPEKDYEIIKLDPTKEQLRYIEELEKYYETEDLIVPSIITALLRIRQICLDPTLVDLRGQAPKTQWIKDYAADHEDQHIIVFSRFTQYLESLQMALEKQRTSVHLLRGGMSKPAIKETCDAFQTKKYQVLLIQIEVGKEALTLDSGDVIIFADKYPPTSDILQAEDRFIATTEERAAKPHTIYDLVMKGTYEEDIIAMLKKRKNETDLINSFKKHIEERRKHE